MSQNPDNDNPNAPALTFSGSLMDAIARLGLNQPVHAGLTAPQIDQQIDLAQRLLGMAINGTPAVDKQSFPDSGIDLALHALMTAYMSLADAYERNTAQAAYMAAQASVALDRLHHNRSLRAPAQLQ